MELKNVSVKTTTNYSYDKDNHLTSTMTTSNQAGVPANRTEYFYDAAGNRVLERKQVAGTDEFVPVQKYTYDDFGRLSGVNDESYTYDGSNQRVSKDGIYAAWSGGKIVGEFKDAGLVSYVFGVGCEGMVDANGTVSVTTQNGRGDIVANTSDSATQTNKFDAFGNNSGDYKGIDNPYSYNGYYTDTETGLYYLNARYYDPETGSFIQEDTVTGTFTDPFSRNLYTYCNNSLLAHADPSGHSLSLSQMNAYVSSKAKDHGHLHVRTGPGTGYGILGWVWPGENVRIDYTNASGTWAHITYNVDGSTATKEGWSSM